MGGQLDGGGRNKRSRRRHQLKSEKGYLLISTLFFLMFSGLFAQSMIKIVGNQMIQFRQISSAYQAKSALNMSKELLRQEINKNDIPNGGTINTSMGPVIIKREERKEEYTFELILIINSGEQYSDDFTISIPKTEKDLPIDLDDMDEMGEKTELEEADTNLEDTVIEN